MLFTRPRRHPIDYGPPARLAESVISVAINRGRVWLHQISDGRPARRASSLRDMGNKMAVGAARPAGPGPLGRPDDVG